LGKPTHERLDWDRVTDLVFDF
jgi:hypothetical protein